MIGPALTPLRSLILIGAAAVVASCGDAPRPPPEPPGPLTTLPSGVVIQDLCVGKGEALIDGGYVALRYDARVIAAVRDATQGDPAATEPAVPRPFDSTRQGEPWLAKVGKSALLAGFAEGLAGMREGGTRRITLAPEHAYGAVGKGEIPPDAILEYEVELCDVFTRHESGLQTSVIAPGDGKPPTDGELVVAELRGLMLETGRELFSTRAEGRALEFRLGDESVLPGITEALRQMAPGAKWYAALPPKLAYGPLGDGVALLPGQELIVVIDFVGVRGR